MTVGLFRAGKGGRIIVTQNAADTNCRLMVYGVQEQCGDLDTTNFENFSADFGSSGSGGGRAFEQGLIGVEVAAWNVGGNWDASKNPMDNPPGFYLRDDGPELKLLTHRADNVYYDFRATRILGAALDIDVKNLVTFKSNGKSQDVYLRPTGSFLV